MRYELMLPHQIRKAIKGNWPVALPLGVLEYHGEHLAVGLDTLVVVKVLEILEGEMDLVISSTRSSSIEFRPLEWHASAAGDAIGRPRLRSRRGHDVRARL